MRVTAMLALLVLVSPCLAQESGSNGREAAPAVVEGMTPTAASDTYRITPGDTLSVVVLGEELLTRDCRVNGSGTISYPMLGDVPVSGATCADLKCRLEEDLRKYLKAPEVSVTVREYGTTGMSVFVMGEVRNPGVYPLVGGAGYVQALAAAGGLSETASGEISLVKARAKQSYTFLLGEGESAGSVIGPMLEPGDVILVLRKREMRYAVLGEVPKPGMFEMPGRGEVRVLDALEQAGLLTPRTDPSSVAGPRDLLTDPARTADLENAQLVRNGSTVRLNLTALIKGDTSQNQALQSGDVLTVPRRQVLTVFAMGEVHAPGRYNLPVGSTVLDLLNAAGGTTTNARLSQGRMVRLVNSAPVSMPVNLGDLLGKGDQQYNLMLQGEDVLFVPARSAPNDAWRSVIAVLPFLRGW
jgi:polysaccharide export outer membrane protein